MNLDLLFQMMKSLVIIISNILFISPITYLYFKVYFWYLSPNKNPSPFALHLLNNAIHQSGPPVSNYEDDDYNLRNFDYSKEICRSDFQYSWNTHRDLILSGGSYDFEEMLRTNQFLFNSIVRSATINRASAPNCKIVFVFFLIQNTSIYLLKEFQI